MEETHRYCPKEVSWLYFNHRVLQEAADWTLPLVERLKFIGIFSSNQDEFFRVRVATLKRIVETAGKSDQMFGYKPIKVLKDVQSIVLKQMEQFDSIYNDLMLSLGKEGIHLINEAQLDGPQLEYVRSYFRQQVRANLVPIMLDQAKAFPDLKDQCIYFAIVIQENSKDRGQYALLEIPTRVLGRFVRLPDRNSQTYIILLDDVVRACLPMVFPHVGKYKVEAFMLKISRDADMTIDDDLDESYVQKISDSLRRRRWGDPTRIIYDQGMPKDLIDLLLKSLEVEETDTLIPGGRYHNHRDFFDFPDLGRQHLVHPPFEFLLHRHLSTSESFFEVLKRRDALLHLPYHSFAPVIDFLREAAVDPQVKSIKMTLYRLARNSKVINALISAAKNGKEVQVVLELQARFDEKANLKWANLLREEGVEVHFGVEGIKIHSKLCLITRREGTVDFLYAMMSTGNFNEATAKVYTDHMLMTTRQAITSEVAQVFSFISKPYQRRSFQNLLVSPLTMRPRLQAMINNEIKNALAGKEAWIRLKLNNLADKEICDLLYKASQVGVDVRLVVRGMCTLIPGIEGVSDKIQVVSIVDRFLEHSRIYMFANTGRALCYLSSADWMTRNLDYRVEVAFPVLDRYLKKEIMTVFDMQWKDNVKARHVDTKGKNEVVAGRGVDPFRSQEETYRYIKSIEK
jgi:polyphosphate kinase